MAQTCGNCPKTTGDGMHLCTDCANHLERDLAEVDSTIEDLWVSSARMDVGSGTVGTSGHATPSEPANLHAMDTGRTLSAVLTGWAQALGHTEPHPVKASAILFAQIREVRRQDWAPVLKQELRDALNDCRRAMDRAANKVFAGICPTIVEGQECGTPVYARQGSGEGRCKTCGTTWDVQEGRARALEAAGHHEGTPAEVSRMLSDPVNGHALPQGTIRQWINRGKLAPIGTNRLGRPVYQVRKVRNLWMRSTSYGKALVA
jgi:hypothetical protein